MGVTLFICYITVLFCPTGHFSAFHFQSVYSSDSAVTPTVAVCMCPTQLKLVIKRAPTLRQIHSTAQYITENYMTDCLWIE